VRTGEEVDMQRSVPVRHMPSRFAVMCQSKDPRLRTLIPAAGHRCLRERQRCPPGVQIAAHCNGVISVWTRTRMRASFGVARPGSLTMRGYREQASNTRRERLHLGSCLTDATPRAVPGTALSRFAATLGPSVWH